MREHSARPAALLLALLLCLTACNTGGGPREVHKVNWVNSPGYTPEDVPLHTPACDLKGCCTDGAYIYILADEKPEDEVRSVLSRVSLADGTAEVLDAYTPPQTPEDAFTNRLGPVMGYDGTLWVYEVHTLMYFDFPEDYDPDEESRTKYYTGQDDFHYLRQLDPATGKEKKLLDLSEAVRTLDIESFFDVAGFAIDGGGNAYFAGKGGVAVIDSAGKHLFTLKADLPSSLSSNTSGGPLALLPDGTVAALTADVGNRVVRTIDPAAKDWGEERYTLPIGVNLIYDGTGGFLFFFTQDGELYAWEPESESPRRLLAWAETGLEGSVMCFAPLDEGRLAALTLQYTIPLTDLDSWYSGQLRASLLSPSGKDPNDGKVRLVYGTILSDSRLRSKINQFNKNNSQYMIELREYANIDDSKYYELSPSEQWVVLDAAHQLLRAEVSAGSSPDIWDSSLDYYSAYARRGYLEDLWPWIDGDGELGGRDALMSHALECASMDGKLYKLSSTFFIRTMIARTDVVGQRTGWTLDEMLDCWRQLPEGASILPPSYDGIMMLETLLRDDGTWVDWSTGECRFDSPEFKEVLELCRLAQENCGPEQEAVNAYTGLRDRQYLVEYASLASPNDLLYYDALCSGPEHLTDYGAYLNENGIYSDQTDEDGNWRDEDAVTCPILYYAEKAKADGMLLGGLWPVAADAVFGALEGTGYAAYAGAPCRTGSGSDINMSGVSMSASCRNKEGAWAFIRQCLLPDAYLESSYSGFPVNKEDFNKLFEPQYFKDSLGEYLLDANGSRIEEPVLSLLPVPRAMDGTPVGMVLYQLSPSEAQRERFMELYESIGPSLVMDLDLMNIITEQAQPYFAGDKSLDETAELIQRRAALFVNENR